MNIPDLRARLCTAAMVLFACAGCHRRPLDLRPPDTYPVFRIQVGDGEEAAILRQRLGITPLGTEGSNLYFADAKGVARELLSFGYQPEAIAPGAAYLRIVEVRKKGEERKLIDRGLLLLRRERHYWIVRGSLAQLDALQRDGYRLSPLTAEPRPRRASLYISAQQVDLLVRSGIDIVGSEGDRKSGFKAIVRGFDYELDGLRAAGFSLTILD